MQYTSLGNTDTKISRICLGTMTWGRQNTEAEGHAQMDYALEQGVNFWDTAEMYAIPPTPKTYGTTETIIGNWFSKTKKRDKVILASKCSPMPWSRQESTPVICRDSIIKGVDGSLKRLKTDYIDLCQLHWPTNRSIYHFDGWWDYIPSQGNQAKNSIIDNTIEVLETCQQLIKEGKIRHLGLSNDSAWGIKNFCDLSDKLGLPRIVSVQNEYSLLRRRDETDVMEACALEELSYLTWSPLEMGIISGKYLNNAKPKGSRFSPEVMDGQEDRFNTRMTPTVLEAVKEYIELADKHNLDVCQLAIAFTVRRPYMSSSIIGATNMQQLKNNIDAMELTLSDEVLDGIERIRRKYPVPF